MVVWWRSRGRVNKGGQGRIVAGDAQPLQVEQGGVHAPSRHSGRIRPLARPYPVERDGPIAPSVKQVARRGCFIDQGLGDSEQPLPVVVRRIPDALANRLRTSRTESTRRDEGNTCTWFSSHPQAASVAPFAGSAVPPPQAKRRPCAPGCRPWRSPARKPFPRPRRGSRRPSVEMPSSGSASIRVSPTEQTSPGRLGQSPAYFPHRIQRRRKHLHLVLLPGQQYAPQAKRRPCAPGFVRGGVPLEVFLVLAELAGRG